MKPNRLNELLRQGQALDKTLHELLKQQIAGEPDPWPALAKSVGDWLERCVAEGRLLPNGSADRRALQGQVDYWTTRLRQADHPRDDVELLADFDPGAGEPLADGDFPYFGLAAVTAEHRLFGDQMTPRFLGRDDQTRAYAKHLSEGAHRALLIESESGGGKSSVAMAGVIPELMSRHGERWLFAPRITPGAQPMASLDEALVAALGDGKPIDASPENVANLLGQRPLLLFVDQLEELLTLCVDARAQQQFSEWLAALAEAGPLRLLATMRIDHHDRLANSASCRALYRLLTVDDSARLLPPLSFEQLRQVILRPAQAVGLRFVPVTLVDRLANETANLPGGLPRLQFALRRLWDLRPPRDKTDQPRLDLIDQGAFDLLPSVSEALGTVAQQLLASLSDTERSAVQRLALELTVLDEKSEAPLRRRRLQHELLALLERAKLATPDQALALIDRFVSAGLLVRTGQGSACQVEVAHESLFRHWKDFQEWVRTDQARGRLKQVREITRDAIEWETHGRKADYLRLAGEPLGQALAFSAEGWLDETAQRYCEACEEARQQQVNADALAAKLREQVRQQQRDAAVQSRWLKRGAGVLLASVMLVGTALYVKQFNSQRKLQEAHTQFATLLGQLEPLDALNLAFTLEKNAPGKFMGPLAHAIDQLQGSNMLGDPKLPMDFTFSGWALVQRVVTREGERALSKIDVWPLNTDGGWWQNKVSILIPLDDPKDALAERLAKIDVSQRLLPDGKNGPQADRRLVLATFFKPPADGQGPNVFTRATLHEILSTNTEPRMFGEFVFQAPNQPHDLSEAAFLESGHVLLSAMRYPTQPGQSPVSQLLSLEFAPDGKLKAMPRSVAVGDASSQENQRVVSAVAQRKDGELVTGRLDGTIFCGDRPIQRTDRSPIANLKVAGPWLVGLHQSGQLVAGNCDDPSKPLLSLRERETAAERLQSLALRNDGNDYRLSFVAERRMCEVVWEPSKWPSPVDLKKSCWVSGLEADQVVPVLGATTGASDIRFLALPDSRRPWLMQLAGQSLAPAHDAKFTPAKGLPIGRPADLSGARSQDELANGTPSAAGDAASAGIRSHGKTFSVWRQVGSGQEETLSLKAAGPDFQPQAVANTAEGTVAVLSNDGRLAVFPSAAGAAPRIVKLSFRLECLALSGGGTQLTASGGKGGRWHLPLRANDALERLLSEDRDKENKPTEPLDACAVADNGTTVTGFKDGRVEVFDPIPDNGVVVGLASDKADPELNPLVRYRLTGGIQALSVDASGRFVAALGKSSQKSCQATRGGRSLNIWDRQQHSAIPVASTCLSGRQITSIGPLRQMRATGPWELEVFEVDRSDLKRPAVKKAPYVCLACGLEAVDLSNPDSSELARRVRGFKPTELQAEELRRAYGIEF